MQSKELISDYINRYRCTVEICMDNNLDTDFEISMFQKYYISKYGIQAALLLFDIAERAMRLDTDTNRLEIILTVQGVA